MFTSSDNFIEINVKATLHHKHGGPNSEYQPAFFIETQLLAKPWVVRLIYSLCIILL